MRFFVLKLHLPGEISTLATVDDVGTVRDVDGNQILSSNVFAVTNYQYEVNLNDAKRRIRVLKDDYLDLIQVI